jgi:hypothetical protein
VDTTTSNSSGCASGVFQAGFGFDGLFNLHIAEFVGVKDIATIQALDKLAVFMPGDDSYSGMLANGGHRLLNRWNKLPFPQIVSTIPHFSYQFLLNVLILPKKIPNRNQGKSRAFRAATKKIRGGLVIPTETVVY